MQNELTAQLADACERYETNRTILGHYRDQTLPSQVRAYRGVYERHAGEPDRVPFGDVVNAQQTLAATINTYLSALDGQWQAVVDLAALLQLDDVSQLGQGECVAPVPVLEALPEPKPVQGKE